MERSELVDIVNTYTAVRVSGDIDKLVSFFTEDAQFRIVGNPYHNPFCGLKIGRQEIRDTLRMLESEHHFVELTAEKIIVEGNEAAVRWHGQIRNRGTGAEAEFFSFLHLIFRGKLIAELTNIFDTATVAALSDRI